MTAIARGGGPLFPGQAIDGWRIVEELGTGSFSSVYRAEKGGLSFALKLGHHRASDSSERVHREERTQRELECLLALRHPNIARVWGHGRWPHPTEGQTYLVLDFVDGFTLGQWKERCAPTPHEAVVLFETLAGALAYMHERGVKHRDIKPANIMVGRQDRQPVIVDYSAADRIGAESLTEERLPPGTPRHRSPEAIRFERQHHSQKDARYEYQIADEIYAFGVTLYDVLTVARLDSAPQYLPVSSEVLEPKPAHRVNPRVPVALSELTAQLLSRDPAQRPVDFEVVRRKLAELRPLQGEEYHGLPIDPPPLPPSASAAGPAVPVSAEPRDIRQRVKGAAGRMAAAWRTRGIASGVSVGCLLLLGLGLSVWLTWGAREQALPRDQPRPGSAPLAMGTGPLNEAEDTARTQPPPEPPAVVPPAPRSAQDSAPSMKGRPVKKKADAVGSSVPSICSRRQPPPATQLALLRQWCRCASLAGTLAFAAACTGPQLKPSEGRCPEEARASMRALGLEGSPGIDNVRLDETLPPGRGVAVYKDGPITAVVEDEGLDGMEVPGGTQLRGEVWTGPFMLRGKQAWHVRFTQLRLPGGDWQPVCFTTPFDGSLIEYDEGSKPGAILDSKVMNLEPVWGRWPFP